MVKVSHALNHSATEAVRVNKSKSTGVANISEAIREERLRWLAMWREDRGRSSNENREDGTSSSSFVYHCIILSTLSVGTMLWSVVQLGRGQLRMVVDVVGSC